MGMEEWKLLVGNQLHAIGSYTELKLERDRLVKIYDEVELKRMGE